jgi:hypothetical protein
MEPPMKTIDSGHIYEIAVYDQHSGTLYQLIQFMKRVGDKYPGNEDAYPGTNCQEVLRVLIDRIKYLNNQIPDYKNSTIVYHLREALRLFEVRAAERHGRTLQPFDGYIEDQLTCPTCGHIQCSGHDNKKP